VVVFPNCKINLGLNILRKREDNFHDLETIFLPVEIHDVLEIVPAENKTHITVSGFSTGNLDNNLCLKAYHLVKKDFPRLPETAIHLHKAVPTGAGLGGGSADAAFMLRLLDQKFHLGIPSATLFDYALLLGSDCPFFLLNQPCLASGRGEVLRPVNVSLDGYLLLLISPGIQVSTAEAFKYIKPAVPVNRIQDLMRQPVDTWKYVLFNDFESYAFEKYPAIKRLKDEMYERGAIYAAMSGTGSSVYGIFSPGATLGSARNPVDVDQDPLVHTWLRKL
jgi:4-diphosphocytidyl-2-C-methyl-D-erythritol kinase